MCIPIRPTVGDSMRKAKGILAAVLLTAAASQLSGQSVAEQKQGLLGRFDVNETNILGVVSELNEDQWAFKPDADSWSISEIMEHIVRNEEWTYGLMSASLSIQDVSEDNRRRAEMAETQLESTFRDRAQTFQAPEALVPTGRWSGQAELVAAFHQHRAPWREFIEKADFDLRSRTAPHPLLGPVDSHQWAVVVVEHGDRHLEQIKEVMAHDAFPNG